jgi:hypothetical protein
MADNCLVGCIQDSTCSGLRNSVIDFEDVVAPWVKMYFGDDTEVAVTVGNQSQPQYGNTAIIKSFQYGRTDGFETTVEIIDEQGGNFARFVDKIAKCMDDISGDSPYGHVAFEFGWTASNCTGLEGGDLGQTGGGGMNGSMQSGSLMKSKRLQGMFQDIEASFENGVVKFRCTMTDLVQSVFVSRIDETIGDDDQPVPLKQAIMELAALPPTKFNVNFRKKDGSEWDFLDDPVARFDADGQNKLSIISKWLEPFSTEDGKGILPVWDEETNTLVLQEDMTPSCREKVGCGNNHIGTFIVNGGRCSPVISFSPKINFVASFSAKTSGGGTTGMDAGSVTKEEGEDCPKQSESVGIQGSAGPVTQAAHNVFGPKEALSETNKSQIKHDKAVSVIQLGVGAITAELTIVGDPRIVGFDAVIGKYASIVVINPFHISGDKGCGDWLASPACNEVLSNKNWMIQAFDHQIKEGSYVTTLKLLLPTPGNELHGDNTAGGDPDGYRPPDICSHN